MLNPTAIQKTRKVNHPVLEQVLPNSVFVFRMPNGYLTQRSVMMNSQACDEILDEITLGEFTNKQKE